MCPIRMGSKLFQAGFKRIDKTATFLFVDFSRGEIREYSRVFGFFSSRAFWKKQIDVKEFAISQ
jgi:hypothetical protein